MRVTNKMLSNNFLRDMRYNLKNLQRLQEQMTSGKEIKKPSDDPFKVARAMQMHTDIGTNKQYNENISDTINWIDTTDTALNQIGNVFQRINELMISAGNGGYSASERNAIKDEINQKTSELSQIMNTSFDGTYIFGGTRGTKKPVESMGGQKFENLTEIKVETPSKWKDKGIKFTVKIQGADVSLDTGKFTEDEVKDVNKIVNTLNSKINASDKFNGRLRAMASADGKKIQFVSYSTEDIKIESSGATGSGLPDDIYNSMPGTIKTISMTKIIGTGNASLCYAKDDGSEMGSNMEVNITNLSDWKDKKLIFSVTNPDGTNSVQTVDTGAVGSVADLKTLIAGTGIFGKVEENNGKIKFMSKEGQDIRLIQITDKDDKIDTVTDLKDFFNVKIASEKEYNQLDMIGKKLKVEISQGVTMDYTVSASDIIEFKNSNGENKDLRNILKNVVNHLDGKMDDGTTVDINKNYDAIKEVLNNDLKDIHETMSNILKIRSEVGAKQNRMDSAKDRNTEENFNMTEILSHTEDIDITEKTMEFAVAQSVYLASLQVSAKVIQPTLMDYLR